jgi:hypothetical protein
MEHGCNSKIFYEDTDAEVPLYCSAHRTEEGRHAAVRNLCSPAFALSAQQPAIPKEKSVEYVCSNKKCNTRKTISEIRHMLGKKIYCIECGRQMIYRKDVEE